MATGGFPVPDSRSNVKTRYGRTVQLTDRMQAYMQERAQREPQQTRYENKTSVELELQREIDKTEQEISHCIEQINRQMSPRQQRVVNAAAPDTQFKEQETAVKEQYRQDSSPPQPNVRDRHASYPFTSTPAANDASSFSRNQSWPTEPVTWSDTHPTHYVNTPRTDRPVTRLPRIALDERPPPRNADMWYSPNLPPAHCEMPRPLPRFESVQDDGAASLLHRLADLLSNKREQLPKMEPDVFDGDIIQFPIWIKSFSAIIESHTDSPSERLYFLNKYTSGAAKAAIEGFLTLDSADAYQQARDTLISRYGDKYKVSEAFKRKLNNWPAIRHGDAEGLRKFADFLQHCNSAMATITYLQALNSAEENHKLVEKLPRNIADRWSRVVDKALYTTAPGEKSFLTLTTGYYPSFSRFCQFITDEARIACGPGSVYATATTKKDSQKQSTPAKGRKAGSFAARATTSAATQQEQNSNTVKNDNTGSAVTDKATTAQQTCRYCRGPHWIDKCQDFIQKSAEEKKSFASSHGLCFGCLRRGHLYSACRRKNPLLLADDSKNPKQNSAQKPQEKPPEKPPETQTPSSASSFKIDTKNTRDNDRSCIHSMILPVHLHHKDDPSRTVFTYALLDNQSDACFISEDLLQQLKLSTEPVTLELTTVLAKQMVDSQLVKGLVVTGLNQEEKIPLPATYSRNLISASRDLIPQPEMVHKWPHLKEVAVHPVQADAKIELLIGINCSRALLPREIITAGDDDPFAVRTSLGWGVTGNMCSLPTGKQGPATHFAFRTSAKEVTPAEVRKMFEIEFAENNTSQKTSVQDTLFMKKMEEGIDKREDGHVELPLPLKKDKLNLPNNKDLVLRRLKSLKRRMEMDDRYREDYTAFVSNMLNKGYAEKLPADAEEPKGHTWYLPHHGVYHPRKPDQIRVVFNCSAEFYGQTLNQELLSGPDMLNSLAGILLRFRQEQIALACDIEAMFYQVSVNPKDRDLLRFVWWPDGDVTKEPCDYRMTVHIFGATSSPACANYALKTAAKSYPNQKTAEFVERNFYVDDGLASVPSVPEALQLITDSQKLCSSGGFNLTKFLSNNKEVMKQIPVEKRAQGLQNIDFPHDDPPLERTLGVQWCLESDSFQFRVMMQDKPLTRRGLLSSVSSVFDPLGLISPFLLTAKRLLQELCKQDADWDDSLPEDIRVRWERWRSDLLILSKLQIPRCYKAPNIEDVKKVELHHFSDASQDAYGQCSYLRLFDTTNNVSCSLVFAKSRVAPVKPVTVPRLELTAALTSVRVSKFLNDELDFDQVDNFYWTDSMVVLGYIANEARRFHVYVANRVRQIRDGSSVEEWKHIGTKENPADVASRGTSAKQLIDDNLWWHGPTFLSTPYPIQSDPIEATLTEEDPEVKRATTHTVTTSKNDCSLLQRLTYFSSWSRAMSAVAICKKYLRKLKERVATRKAKNAVSDQGSYTPPSVEELQQAEEVILKAVQKQAFPEEVDHLSDDNAPRTRSRSRLHRLDPFMTNDGLIRVGGRVRRANVPRSLAHPVILPRDGHITTLIIRHHHERMQHAGRGTTLNEIRASGYWLIKIRSTVASYIGKCVTGRKLGGSASKQKMSDLPSERLDQAAPFTYCGVDMFGPFYIKEGRSEKKRWGCLFTCTVTRAIHIEVTNSLSTDSFINAYRRFIGRRGPVRQIRCDRGTNFVGAKNELQMALNEMDHERIQRTLSQDQCDWVQFKFNVPAASHMGGFWERMIRSARKVLCALLDQHGDQLDDELLRTYMVETEAIVNSRPLTYVDVSSADSKEPLSPSQLLTLKSKVVLPLPGVFVKEDMFCRRRWRRIQYLVNEFWSRWRKEYLPTLQERAKWTTPQDNLQKDDIVLMMSENVPRGQWPKAVVVQTYPSEDGYIRKVSVKTASGTFDRPVHKLVLLLRPGFPNEEP